MKQPSVYLETSVVSALVDERNDPVRVVRHDATLRWWQEERHRFRLFTSEAVFWELSKHPLLNTREVLAYLDEMIRLPLNDDVEGAATVYQEQLLMPKEEVGDAVHLAVASVHKMEYLLTWNCRHLANINKIRHLQAINRRLGLMSPILLTPEMLILGGEK